MNDETAAAGGGSEGQSRAPRQPSKRGRGAAGPDLKGALRDFASAMPHGWGHQDWINFLESLHERGHNINDRDAIGLALEKERLDLFLDSIRGVGPRRRAALIERYGTLWNVRNAEVEEIARVAKMPRSLAEEVKRKA